MPLSDDELRVRVTVVQPPAGVTFAIQVGKSDLLPPVHADARTLSFDLVVRLDSKRGAQPRFLGPAVHGPPTARFIYVNSGTRAGQATSCWDPPPREGSACRSHLGDDRRGHVTPQTLVRRHAGDLPRSPKRSVKVATSRRFLTDIRTDIGALVRENINGDSALRSQEIIEWE